MKKRTNRGRSPVTLAQRRQLDGKNRQAVVEIRTERARRPIAFSRSRLVAATTRTSTYVVFVPPQPLELALLQHSQQLRLQVQR